jgi:hypothetical protein
MRSHTTCAGFLVPLVLLLFTSAAWGGVPPFTGHAGLLAPKADPVSETSLAFYALGYPPLGLVQAAIPLTDRFATVLSGGYFGVWSGGSGGVASAIFRADLFHPTDRSWGVTGLGYWMGGGAIDEGEGSGTAFYGGAFVASSPMRLYRAHITAALHSLPGTHNDGVAPTFIVAAERVTEKYSLFTEVLYSAPTYEDDDFTTLVVMCGAQFFWESVTLKFGTGVIRFIGEEMTLPAPPLFAVVFPL